MKTVYLGMSMDILHHGHINIIEQAAKCINLEITWRGHGIDEEGLSNGKEIIKVDKRYFRPTEVDELLGDSTKAKEKLNWEPQISLSQLISEMIEEDLKEAKKDAILKKKGYPIYSSKE